MKNKVVNNASWLIAGRMIQMAVSLIIGMLTARFLGPANYGLINYAGAFFAFALALCFLGINSVLVKELIDNPTREGEVLGTAITLRFLATAFAFLGIVCTTLIMDFKDYTTITVVCLYNFSLFFQVVETFSLWFQSRLESKVIAIVSLTAYLCTAIYKVWLLIEGKNVFFFALANSVDFSVLGFLFFLAYKKHGGASLSFSYLYAKDLLGRSCHFILPSLMAVIFAQTDKIMLKHMISDAEIGYYSTASTISIMWCFVLTAIIDSLYPPIMQAYKDKDMELFNRRNRMLYFAIFYISLAVSVVICIFATPIVRLLYGESYAPASVPLRILTWLSAFSYLGMARNAWIVAKGKQRYLTVLYIASACINVLMNIILIPVWGGVGAALASLVTQLFTIFIVPSCIRDLRENSLLIIESIICKENFFKDFFNIVKQNKS